MPQNDLIDHYVDRSSFRDDTEFILANLKEVLDTYKKVSSTKVNLGGTAKTGDTLNAAKQLNAELAKSAKLNEASAKASLLEAKARKEQALQQKAEAQARKENAAAAMKEQQASSSAAKEKAAEQKIIDNLTNEYAIMSKAYNEAALKAKNYFLTLGENHPITIEAVKDAKAMHDILLRVDQSVGQSQRNVGNYKSAFDGLGMSFTQIARELPSLAISAQQFVLAISNNLPMVQDEIKKAREEIAALKAQGKDTPSLLQRIGSSIISWNVGLSVGIALLTAYGGKLIEWAKNLLDGSAAAREAAKQQAELNERQLDAIEIADKYDEARKRSSGVINRGLENQIAYAKAAGKDEVEILKLEKALLENRQELAQTNFFGTNGEAELSKLGSELDKAREALDDFNKTGQAFGKELEYGSKEYKKQKESLTSNFEFAAKQYGRQKEIVEEFYDANRDLQIKDLELQKALKEQRVKFFSDELQYRADILKKFSELEDGQIAPKVNARKAAFALEKQIIDGQYQDELIAAKGSAIKIFEANREYAFKRKKLAEELEADLFKIRQTSIARQRELESEWNQMFYEDDAKRIKQKEEAQEREFQKRKNYLEEGRDILLKSIDAERNQKILSASGDKERQRIEEEYNNKRKKVEIDTNIAIMQSALELAQAKLKVAAKGADKTAVSALEAEIAALKEALEKLKGVEIDLNIDKAKGKLEKLKAGIQEVGGKILELFDGISDLITANIDAEKNAIQEQMDDIDKKKEKEIEAVNASTATEQEKADKIAVINARSQSQKETLERRQRQLDLQRARFEKARNIMEAIVRTSVAVLDGLIKGGPPLAAIYGAIGAVQIASAIAAPLPKFKHGRNGGDATLGIVGDGGRKEVIYSPDLSDIMITPDKDTLAFIPQGYSVAPSIEDFQATAMKMANRNIPVPVLANNNDGLIAAMAYEIGGLKTAILGKQETHFHWNNGELKKAVKNGANWYRYLNDNL
jgi:hypothetical protein